MATKYSGTQTEKNLEAAFAGESQARNKYTFFASKAKKEGFEQIAALFLETAENEKEHAKMWFKYLQGGAIKDTVENLKDAAAGENIPPTFYSFTFNSFVLSARSTPADACTPGKALVPACLQRCDRSCGTARCSRRRERTLRRPQRSSGVCGSAPRGASR